MKMFGMYFGDVAVFALFLYSAFVISNDIVCTCDDECQCKKTFYVILGLTLLYAFLRAAGIITYTEGLTFRPPSLSPQNYSLSSSRFGGGLRLGAM